MTETIEANPNLAAAHLRRAELLLLRADWRIDHGPTPEADLDDAVQALNSAAEINPNDAGIAAVEAEVWRRRAQWLVSSESDPDDAIALGLQAAKRALATDPNRATAWVERAHLEHLAGNGAAADAAATEALRLDPWADLPVVPR